MYPFIFIPAFWREESPFLWKGVTVDFKGLRLFCCFVFKTKQVLGAYIKGRVQDVLISHFVSSGYKRRKGSVPQFPVTSVCKSFRGIHSCLLTHSPNCDYLFSTPLLYKRGSTLSMDFPFPIWHLFSTFFFIFFFSLVSPFFVSVFLFFSFFLWVWGSSPFVLGLAERLCELGAFVGLFSCRFGG